MQKHFRVVFIVLLVVLIVAFVFTIGNQGPMGGGNDQTSDLQFYDTQLGREAERMQLQRDAQLSASLARNNRPSPNLSFERATVRYIANQNLIPEPTEEQLRDYIETLPAFQNQLGQFDAQAYNMAIDSLRFGGAFTEKDLHRVLVDDYRIAKVYAVLRGDGFVNESEILESLGQRLAKWSIVLAEIDLDTYTPEVEITEEMLTQHYEDFSFSYQTPERRVVDYIEIDSSQYIDQIKPTEDELLAYFEANIERYQPPAAEGEEPTEPVTYEQARLAVREDLRREQARDLAAEKAHDLVVAIVENDFSRDSNGFETLIANSGSTLKTASSFAANETPIGTTWGPQIVSQAFELSEERFYSEPLPLGNASLILFYSQVIEPAIPSFETLRQRIMSDARAEAYRKARAEFALELQSTLDDAASESQASFEAAAEDAGLTLTPYEDFSLTEPAEGLDRRALSAMLPLETGDISDLIRLDSENQGAFLYVVSKDVPEVSKDDPQYTQVEQSLKNLYGQFSADQYIQTLVQQEMLRIGLIQQAN